VRSSLCKKKFSRYETQQIILGTGTAIWWVTEPRCLHLYKNAENEAKRHSSRLVDEMALEQMTS
jgi:hypothetical protein